MENNEDNFLEFSVHEPIEDPAYTELYKIIAEAITLLRYAKEITTKALEDCRKKSTSKNPIDTFDFLRRIQYAFQTKKIREKEHLLFRRLAEIVHIVHEIPDEILELQAYLTGYIPSEKLTGDDANIHDVVAESIGSIKPISDQAKRHNTAKYFGKYLAKGGKIDNGKIIGLTNYKISMDLGISPNTAGKYVRDKEILKEAEQWKNRIIAQRDRKAAREKI